jgi:hypothetical protein
MELTPEELLEMVITVDGMDLPDGAHFAMLEDLTGMDAVDVYMAIEHLTDDAEEECE